MRHPSHDAAHGDEDEHDPAVTVAEWIRRLALVPRPEGGYLTR
jgi:hypothetical protein